MPVWIAPLANVAVVVKAPIGTFVLITVFLLFRMLEMGVYLYFLEPAIMELAAPVGGLPFPVNIPKNIVMVCAID
ncbi:MAG: hypothetical protein V7746_19670 [Halioglobus sp.]